MSSDEDYAAFLEKANQDTGAKVERDGSFVKTKAVDTEVPGPLKSLDAFYTSETDEPFEPVALEWKGGRKVSESELFVVLIPAELSRRHFCLAWVPVGRRMMGRTCGLMVLQRSSASSSAILEKWRS